MFDVGRLCVKIAGRDAREKCVVVDVIDQKYVLVDGQTRRKKVNVAHLEPLSQTIEISKGASHEEVAKAFEKMGLAARNTSPKQKSDKPSRTKEAKEDKPAPKVVKKEPKAKPSKPAKEKKVEAEVVEE